MNRKAFTLFELLAVLTVISLGLVVLLGSYSSWGTVHALTGATRVLEAGLLQARGLAVSGRNYVGFDYGSYVTNDLKTVTGFQIFICTPTNDAVTVEEALQAMGSPGSPNLSASEYTIKPAAPYQRLSGHVGLAYIEESNLQQASPATIDQVTFFFRPDGSVWSWDDKRTHTMAVYTRERFADRQGSRPLTRFVRIDLSTGFATVTQESAP